MNPNAKRSIRFAVIGSGEGGGRIADAFARLGYRAGAINTAQVDLDGLQSVPKANRLCVGSGPGGAACNAGGTEDIDQPVDVPRRQAGVVERRLGRLAGELELAAPRLLGELRLPDAGDGGAQVPRGPPFMSPAWRELFKHAVREADQMFKDFEAKACCIAGHRWART
jgi:hypothetical protein